jgi:two-component system chemotaxis response regulator CheB
MTIRAVIVDDSIVVRHTVANVLGATDDVEIVATASSGRMGLSRIAEFHPDVVTLDVEMPGMNGLETLAEIRKEWPELPVIMYSTLTERGATATFDALAIGAADYATKPSGATSREAAEGQVRDNLLPLVRLWGGRVGRMRLAGRAAKKVAEPISSGPITYRSPGSATPNLVVLGVSTGGPDALAALVPDLPADLPVPMMIVQHMPPVFTAMLAQRLDKICPLQVSEAVDGEHLEAGHIYLAPGGRHLEVHNTRTGLEARLTDAEPENSCRPAVDVLFRTAAHATGSRTLGVVLTGMGQDGLFGAQEIVNAGGSMLVQDEASSVVWGMPGFVARAGLATAALPLSEVANAIGMRAKSVRTREAAV